jgi:uncharacterized damage-inducible protein DinB
MSESKPWLERVFTFDLPVELHPSLRARLRGTPARLDALTRGLDPERLTARPGDAWSIQENAGHLLSVEELWRVRLREFLEGAPLLTAADVTGRRTHEARHNERPLAEILSAFHASRQGWLAVVDGLPTEAYSRSAFHPRLQRPIRLLDHLQFAAEHDDHHLARIWELREARRDEKFSGR